MEFLEEKKNDLKDKVDRLYQCYGHLCATNPLPLIATSVCIVIFCSLPLLSHPVFERTVTFLFGRIQLGKYKTNISITSDKYNIKPRIVIEQIKINLNVTVLESHEFQELNTWNVFQKALETTGIKDLNSFCRTSESFNWTSNCLHVSRKPFYQSPQTRLIYPRGRFHKELRKWFSKPGCLLVSPSSVYNVDERKFKELPEPFKELLFGYPMGMTGLSVESQKDRTFQFCFTISFFMRDFNESFSSLMKNYFSSKENSTVATEKGYAHQVRFLPTEEDSHAELMLLSMTYVLVFFYILFSVGKISMLKSRWGLAFSAVMTIIMSMIMALGVCASLDILPTILTITEIFPYVVIVIGLENVLTITKSVASTPGDVDVSVQIAKGMGKEGWYVSKNLFAELTILGAGYFTWIPSLQEFCIFAYVGVLSDFFIQMVFFAPVLAVDIRRAEICHLEQITIGQDFKIGFNLMQKTALILIPPSPPKTRWSRFRRFWVRKRMFQKAMMTAVVIYIVYAVHQKVQNSSLEDAKSKSNIETVIDSESDHRSLPSSSQPDKSLSNTNGDKFDGKLSKIMNQSLSGTSRSPHSMYDNDLEIEDLKGDIVSWDFLSRQHWPELLTFYHIRFSERSLVILPALDVSMTIHLNLTDPDSAFKFTNASTTEEVLLVASLAICIFSLIFVLWLAFVCLSKRKRRLSSWNDVDLYKQTRTLYHGHRHSIEFVCTDESYIVAVCLAGYIRVWYTESPHCLMEITPNHRSNVTSNVYSTLRQRRFSPGNRFNAVAESDPSCSIWCLDCKHQMLAVAISTGVIEVYFINTKKLIAIVHEEEAVLHVKIASRNTIIVGRIDGILDIIEINRSHLDSFDSSEAQYNCSLNQNEVVDPTGCRIKHRVKAHIGPVDNLMIFSGTVLCSSTDLIKVYEIDDANCCNSVSRNGLQITAMHQIKKQTCGLSVAVGYEDGGIIILSAAGETSLEYNWHKSFIRIICSNSKYLASLDTDGKISVWSSEAKCIFSVTNAISSYVHALDFINAFVLCAVLQESLVLFDTTDGSLLWKTELPQNNCDCTNINLICFPGRNSVIIASKAFVEQITFPNLDKVRLEETDT